MLTRFAPRTLSAYAGLVALAVGMGWLASYLAPKDDDDKSRSHGKIDYYSKNLRRTVLDEAGKPKELLLAETMTHFEEDDRVELEKPVMTLYSKQGLPWVIHSERATMPSGGEEIFLNGAVTIERASSEGGEPLRIATREARVEPKRNYAETAEFVRVTNATDELTGIGAKVFFGDDFSFSILAHVRRKHEVETP